MSVEERLAELDKAATNLRRWHEQGKLTDERLDGHLAMIIRHAEEAQKEAAGGDE